MKINLYLNNLKAHVTYGDTYSTWNKKCIALTDEIKNI